jgi:predicted transcriptional regulator
MSSITLEIPDELAERLRALADRLARILDLGLRAMTAESVERTHAGRRAGVAAY